MIKVEHLTKRYGNLYALDDISFQIGEGEIVGLLGPNGAGKSTAMNIITGYISPGSGEVTVGGYSVTEHPLEAKRSLGYLPEQPPVYGDMTVGEYLSFIYDLKGCTLPREAHLADITAQVKIDDVRSRLIRNLSKGYRQRVGIAQALVGDPKLIIFDEPTVGLDPKQIIEVRNLLRVLARRRTVLISTHILAEIQAVCERVIIINHGKIIADELTENLSRMVENTSRYRYAVEGPEKEVTRLLRSVSGVSSVTATSERDGDCRVYIIESDGGADCRKNIWYALSRDNRPIISACTVKADLETVFVELVDRSNRESKGEDRI